LAVWLSLPQMGVQFIIIKLKTPLATTPPHRQVMFI